MKRGRLSRQTQNGPQESLLPCECPEVASQLHHYPFNCSAHGVRHQFIYRALRLETKYNIHLDVEREEEWEKMGEEMNKWMNEKKYNRMMFRFCFLVSGVTNSQVQEIQKISWSWSYISWSRKHRLMSYMHCNLMLRKIEESNLRILELTDAFNHSKNILLKQRGI